MAETYGKVCIDGHGRHGWKGEKRVLRKIWDDDDPRLEGSHAGWISAFSVALR